MQIKNTMIEVVPHSVTSQKVDAIVNAANEAMQGGGALDEAIHREAGPELMKELKRLAPHGAWTGSAIITSSHNMSSKGIKHIIHTAGPDARPKKYGDDQLLACSYRSCLEVATRHELTSLAFCSLSTGVFKYPLAEAAPLAVKTIIDYLNAHPETTLRRVVFAMWGPDEFAAFNEALKSFKEAI